jgi:hypothetical protein
MHHTLTPQGVMSDTEDMGEFFAPWQPSLDDDLQCLKCLGRAKRRAFRLAAGGLE